jgi:hypothetical protein
MSRSNNSFLVDECQPPQPAAGEGDVDTGGSELWSLLRRYYSSITHGGFNVLGNGLQILAEQKKAQETRIKQEQQAGVIDRLLNEANKQGEKTNVEGTSDKEVASAM